MSAPTPTPDGERLRERARALVAGLSRSERIGLVSGKDFWHTQALHNAGTPDSTTGRVDSMMVTDGPHGLRKQTGAADHVGLADSVPATCFPLASLLASTWDPALLEEVGAALGREARAEDVGILLGPGLNLKRHPRGGRNFEYFSEDPLLSGRLAAALVRGIQSEGVGACLKHYAANNQETARMVIDTIIDERTLRELYLRGFEIAVAESAPAALMTAYNQVNGEFCSDHRFLLARVLRGEWAYDGLVMSDWGGTNDRIAGLAVGMDLEMPGGGHAFDSEVADAVDDGRLDEADLDRSAARVVEAALRWQSVRNRGAVTDDLEAADDDWVAAHHALARRVGAAGTVLLTNNGILPLRPTASLAVIGTFATQPRYQGAGSSLVHPTRLDNVLDELTTTLAERAPDTAVSYAPGYDAATGETTDALIGEATTAAADADQVLLLLGLPARAEAEARDREHCRLPDGHERLVRAVLAANPDTVVVLVNGGSLELDWADDPAALVEAYLGGQAAAGAIVDVVLGDAEPGGRLAESFPVRVSDLPADANFPGAPRQVEYREGLMVGYRFHDTAGVPARFPFGHGLAYTTFEYVAVEVTGSGTDLTVRARLTNTGERAGSTVVQVYLAAPEGGVPHPAKELRGFAKATLDPGESAIVDIALDRRAFTVWDIASQQWLVQPGRYEIQVGSSSTQLHHRATVDIASEDQVSARPSTAGPVATDEEFAALLGRPVPVPVPTRPFTRSSPIADLGTTALGRVLVAGLRRGMARQIDLGDDEQTADLIANVVTGLPVRGLAQMGAGPLTLARLDRLLALLNRKSLRALRGRR